MFVRCAKEVSSCACDAYAEIPWCALFGQQYVARHYTSLSVYIDGHAIITIVAAFSWGVQEWENSNYAPLSREAYEYVCIQMQRKHVSTTTSNLILASAREHGCALMRCSR